MNMSWERLPPRQLSTFLRLDWCRCYQSAHARSGCKVVVIWAALWDPETMPPEDTVKTALLLLDRLIEEEETQVHGFELFEDLDGVSFFNIFRISQNEYFRKGIMVELMQVYI